MSNQMLNQIQILQQIVNEDKFNRNQVRDLVIKEFQQTSSINIDIMVLEASKAIAEYLSKHYSYDSKNQRVSYLKNRELFSTEILTKEIFYFFLANPGRIRIQRVVGQLSPILRFEDYWDGIKTMSEILICIAKEVDFYNVYLPSDPESETGSIEMECCFAVSDELEQTISDFQYVPPMVTKPNRITNNKQDGYLTRNKGLLLGGYSHNMKQDYETINILNQCKLSLNQRVLENEETSKKPLDTLEKQKSFELMKSSSRKMYELIMEQGNEFYFDWKYDSRGRFYSSGYHINLQSTEYKKSLISLANKEIIPLE